MPIYYESRLARLALPEAERPRLDEAFEEVIEGQEAERKELLKARWAQLEAVVGADERIRLAAQDIAAHFEQRLEALTGKEMIACMSRHIRAATHQASARLRPDWVHNDDRGAVKGVMTGSAADPHDSEAQGSQPFHQDRPAQRIAGERSAPRRERTPADLVRKSQA